MEYDDKYTDGTDGDEKLELEVNFVDNTELLVGDHQSEDDDDTNQDEEGQENPSQITNDPETSSHIIESLILQYLTWSCCSWSASSCCRCSGRPLGLSQCPCEETGKVPAAINSYINILSKNIIFSRTRSKILIIQLIERAK